MNQKKKIACLIICKNEEALIGRALESVKWCDATFVADTGSVDSTVSIARQYTPHVLLGCIWPDDFSFCQNWLIEQVRAHEKLTGEKYDFFLSLDSDEILLSDEKTVREAVELAKDVVRVKMVAEGSLPNTFGFGRLFRNTPEIYWCQPIHKHLNVPGEGEPVGNVSIMYGYSPAHLNDPDRSLRMLEKTVEDEGKDSCRNLYYLGREYWYKQRYKECTATLGRYVQVSYWDAEKSEAFLIMSQSYSAQGLDEDARDACLQAIKVNPEFKEAIEWMASIVPKPHSKQWKRMAKTANNNNILWNRVLVEPLPTILIEPHQDDSVMFACFTLLRLKPLVISLTSSKIQPLRGEVGCDADTRKQETIKALEILGCPVVFMDIPDNELSEDVLRKRLRGIRAETIYIPAYHENGNEQHNLINKVCLELFGRENTEQFCSYSKTDLMIKGSWEIPPTAEELTLKNKALDCFQSQINLNSMRNHFEFVRNKSEWLA